MATTRLVRPDEDLTWLHDWTDWLPGGEAISSRQWSISPTGPTLSNATAATVQATDFTSGIVYRLKEVVTTDGGLVGSREIVLRCQ